MLSKELKRAMLIQSRFFEGVSGPALVHEDLRIAKAMVREPN